ncbi:MAG: hypothetical protein J2P21_23720 [Chloracidobacterium sp.]|nr:hypothetical protein [Chloracidobacterium sp.]
MSSEVMEPHPYDPNGKRFAIQTLCSVIAQAQSWDEVMIGCEALANSMRIVTSNDDEALIGNSQAAAALGHLKDLGREIREHNGKSNIAANSNEPEADPAVSSGRNGKG